MMLFQGFYRSVFLSLALSLLGAGMANSAPAHQGPPAHVVQAFKDRFNGDQINGIQRAIEAQERHTAALLENEGIVGTGISIDASNRIVVKVFTTLTASSAGIPESIDGVPVVVEATGRIYAQSIPCAERADCNDKAISNNVYDAQISAAEPPSQRDWHERPVPIGVSVGPMNESIAGTLGCRVSKGCHKYALTNNHVMTNENTNAPGVEMLQPGRYDGGIANDDGIGELYDFVPIVFSTHPTTNNRVDAAIVAVTTDTVGIATRADGYGTPRSTTAATAIAPSVGLQVLKYGRTTAETVGYIDSLNATVDVDYDSGTARFKGQIVIKKNGGGNFSTSGDSGSLVVASGGADDLQPVGLMFASGEGITVANPIDEVLAAFDVEIDGQ